MVTVKTPAKAPLKTVRKPAAPAKAVGAVVKTAAKPVAKPAAKTLPQPASKKTAAPVKAAAATPPKLKNKLVRDSFTIPKSEYTELQGLKLRAANLKRPVKKSELLRAGINALRAMNDAAFLAALSAVPSLKTGRPTGKTAAA